MAGFARNLTFSSTNARNMSQYLNATGTPCAASCAPTTRTSSNALPQFLADSAKASILAQFIRKRIDLGRAEGLKLAS